MTRSRSFQVIVQSPDAIGIEGHVGAWNVEALKEEVISHLEKGGEFCIDLSGIKGFNTMLLAALCAWTRFARKHNVVLTFSGVTDGMHAIADLSQVDDVLFGRIQNKNKG